jgi:hypothetical protein
VKAVESRKSRVESKQPERAIVPAAFFVFIGIQPLSKKKLYKFRTHGVYVVKAVDGNGQFFF